VSRDRFHPGPKIQALLSVHLGLTTVNVSLVMYLLVCVCAVMQLYVMCVLVCMM